jgi:hypothetical protein
MPAQQTYANHAKVVPAYHYFTFGLIAIYFGYRLYLLATAFSLAKSSPSPRRHSFVRRWPTTIRSWCARATS